MSAARLKAGILVQAILRLYDQAMIPAYQRRRGDADSGAVLVKIALGIGQGALLLSQTRDAEGNPAWLKTGPLSDPEIELQIDRNIKFDPDLWVIEAEDARGRFPLDEKIL